MPDPAEDLVRRHSNAGPTLVRFIRQADSDTRPGHCTSVAIADKALKLLPEIDSWSAVQEAERLLGNDSGMPLLQWTSTSILLAYAPGRARRALLSVFRRKPPYWFSLLGYERSVFQTRDAETIELLAILRASTSDDPVRQREIESALQYYAALLERATDGGKP